MVLVLELTSTRLYTYVGSAHATSTALSIALLGLGLGAVARLRWPQVPRWGALALSASLSGLALAAIAGAAQAWLVVASLPPFACAGALIADAYATRGPDAARATYAIDLLAAAIGCLIAPRLIGPLAPTEIVLGLAILAGALGLSGRGSSRTAALLIAAPIALVIAGRAGALPDGPLAALLASDLDGEKAMVAPGVTAADVVDSAWSPLGRLDVLRAPDDDTRLGVYTDGMSPTFMVRAADARAGAFASTWGVLMALPYRALRPERVLVLGAGAGASVWLALRAGAARVDAVEVNPALPAVLARWRDFAGDVYHQPGVQLIIDDARHYLAETDARYDLIELALALTGNAHAQPAGLESHLYTVEAVRRFLDRLTPTGALVFIHSDPGNAYRQLRTAIDALVEVGVARERALDGIAVLRDPRPETAYQYLLVVSRAPLAMDVVDRLDVEPAQLLWGPGDPPERQAELLDASRLGVGDDDDFAPVHDQRPYFFQNTRGLVRTALAQPGRLWVFAGAIALVVLLIAARGADARGFARPAAVATGTGAAFLTVELALIQRFTLAAGGTLYAVSFVLFGLLAWSAIGALLIADRWRRYARGVTAASLVAALAVAATAWLVRDLAWLDDLASDVARRVVILALLAPVGMALGGPFPTLLAQHGAREGRIASLWAINGAASVAGGVIAVLALRVFGATDALLLAAAIYLLIALIAPRRAR